MSDSLNPNPAAATDVTADGVVTEWLKPFTFRVRLTDGKTVLCGLERTYFGHIEPNSALRILERDGPHVGSEVAIRLELEPRAGGLQGQILRPRRGR